MTSDRRIEKKFLRAFDDQFRGILRYYHVVKRIIQLNISQNTNITSLFLLSSCSVMVLSQPNLQKQIVNCNRCFVAICCFVVCVARSYVHVIQHIAQKITKMELICQLSGTESTTSNSICHLRRIFVMFREICSNMRITFDSEQKTLPPDFSISAIINAFCYRHAWVFSSLWVFYAEFIPSPLFIFPSIRFIPYQIRL